MFTVIAYDEDRALAVADLDTLDGVDDDHVRVIGDDIYCPSLNILIGAYVAHGTGVTGDPLTAQISSPSLRMLNLLDIARMHTPDLYVADEMVDMFPDNPIALVKDEALNILMTNGAVAVARGVGALFLSDGAVSPVYGEIRQIRATSVLTGVADEWTSGALTFAQDLPVGRYQVVGMRCISAAQMGVARLIFVGYQWRAGVPITTTIWSHDLSMFRNGRLGVWGEFDQLTPPRLEVLSVDSAVNPDVYLDLMKVS